jgi:hypothetical protein
MAVARTQPLVVAPQRITESMPCEISTEARFVPKNAEATFFTITVSSGRRWSRGSSSTQRPPSWRSPSDGTFWSHSPPSLRLSSKPMVVKITGRPLSRAASSSRFVASTSAVRSEPRSHSGSVKPQEKSTTSTAGREPIVILSPSLAFA